MKIKIKLLVAFFLVSSFLLAQQKDTTALTKSFSLKINSLQLCAGEVRFLVEKYINERNSIELILGYFLNYQYLYKDETSWRNGYKIGVGYRHYFGNGFYLNPLFFYKSMEFKNVSKAILIGYVFNQSEPEHGWSRFDFTKQTYSLQLQAGNIFRWKNFVVDNYIGIGARSEQAVVLKSYSEKQEGVKHIIPTLHLGINVGYIKR